MARQKSRAKRFAEAASDACEALTLLQEVHQEYVDWFENMPESLQQGPTGEKLQEVCDLDIESALDTINEATDIDLPSGWGRD